MQISLGHMPGYRSQEKKKKKNSTTSVRTGAKSKLPRQLSRSCRMAVRVEYARRASTNTLVSIDIVDIGSISGPTLDRRFIYSR